MKSVNIHTLGCQMNVYDSEQIMRLLSPLGYYPEADPEKADLVILNTCSIRQKAADKAFSFLGRLKKRKEKEGDVLIGVGGCVAQQEGEEILKRAGYVDFVFGTDTIFKIGEIVKRAENGEKVSDTVVDSLAAEPGSDSSLPDFDTYSGFVSIMRGCDNFCTYCIVPFVRGREKSRTPEEIISEISRRADKGMKEVTLLGQNVNSYGMKENAPDFSDLLYMVADIKGIERIRFATSHPKDLSDRLINCYADIEKLCTHFHIPVQSGSDNILKKMNRRYTRGHYLERINALRNVCPDIELSTDIIVGFPGETETDFAETMSLVNEVEYDSVFAFAYSDRPGTRAASFDDKVDPHVKKERLNTFLERQNFITKKKNSEFEGKTADILVEKADIKTDKNNNKTAVVNGRSFGNRIVHINENKSEYNRLKSYCGEIKKVKIVQALGHSLKGEFV